MKISTKSLHYRLAEFFNSPDLPSRSLCLYFWQVIGGIFILSSAGIVCMMLIITTLSPFLMYMVSINEVTVVGLFVSVFYIIGGISYLFNSIKGRLKPNDFVSVTVNYITAKKNKICPSLEFGD